MAGSRSVLLPLALAVLALLCGASCFVGGSKAPATSALRATQMRAVPMDVVAESSVTTALAVSTPGWWANIVGLMVPLIFLVVLYLQSEP